MSTDVVVGVVVAGIPIAAMLVWHMMVSPKAWRIYLGGFVAVVVLGGIGLAARQLGGSDTRRAVVETAGDREADLEDRIRVLEGSVSHLRSELDDLRSKIRSVESDVSGLQR